MNIRPAIAAAALTLAIAGCSPATSPAVGPSPSASATPTVPVPSKDQAKDLETRLAPLAPKVPTKELVRYARGICYSVLRKANDERLLKDVTKLFSVSGDPVTNPEAINILEAIRANGFCK